MNTPEVNNGLNIEIVNLRQRWILFSIANVEHVVYNNNIVIKSLPWIS